MSYLLSFKVGVLPSESSNTGQQEQAPGTPDSDFVYSIRLMKGRKRQASAVDFHVAVLYI